MTPDQFMQLYERATASHDLEGTLALIADDALYLFSDASTHAGKDAIRAVLASNFASIKNETYRLSHLRWLAMSDDLTVCAYLFDWTGEIDGEARSGQGRGTSAIRRTPTGWEVVLEHLSAGRL